MHKMYVDSNLKLGDGVDLMCSLKRGSAPVHFAWYHNGREIRAEDKLGDVVSLQGKSILVVREISRDHIGNYTCSVRNPAGSDSYTVKLYVDGECPTGQQKKHVSYTTVCKTGSRTIREHREASGCSLKKTVSENK